MIASLEDGLSCAIVSIPLADLVELVARHAGVSDYLDLRQMLTSAKPISRMISPLGLSPRVPLQGRFICAGIADRLVHPRDEATRLWEHWDRPEICWFREATPDSSARSCTAIHRRCAGEVGARRRKVIRLIWST